MLTNFPKSNSYNLGGLRSFQFVHRSAISAWPGIFNGKVLTPISLKEGFEWLTGYATPETLSFSENSKDEQNGPYYEKEITGFVPGNKDELIDLMNKMDGHEFVLIVKDPNNQTRLVGSHGFPLLFSSLYNSGAGRPDARGFNFKFTGVSIFRAPVYL